MDVLAIGSDAEAAARELEGATVHSAGTAADALAVLLDPRRRSCPDLVVLDLELPDMNGLELLDHMRRDWRACTVPAVVVVESEAERQRVVETCGGATAAVVAPATAAAIAGAASVFSLRWRTAAARPSV